LNKANNKVSKAGTILEMRMKTLIPLIAAFCVLLPLNTAATTIEDSIAKGRLLSFERSKGNCLARHIMQGGELPGNVGPPLMSMKARYPNKTDLKNQIWDATKRNPSSVMPPFGRHGILTEKELEYVVEYIYTL
jgi:sulfur-oxidizing protein SoxX